MYSPKRRFRLFRNPVFSGTFTYQTPLPTGVTFSDNTFTSTRFANVYSSTYQTASTLSAKVQSTADTNLALTNAVWQVYWNFLGTTATYVIYNVSEENIYESGTRTFAIGDTFAVSYIGTTVSFTKNGSTVASFTYAGLGSFQSLLGLNAGSSLKDVSFG